METVQHILAFVLVFVFLGVLYLVFKYVVKPILRLIFGSSSKPNINPSARAETLETLTEKDNKKMNRSRKDISPLLALGKMAGKGIFSSIGRGIRIRNSSTGRFRKLW